MKCLECVSFGVRDKTSMHAGFYVYLSAQNSSRNPREEAQDCEGCDWTKREGRFGHVCSNYQFKTGRRVVGNASRLRTTWVNSVEASERTKANSLRPIVHKEMYMDMIG